MENSDFFDYSSFYPITKFLNLENATFLFPQMLILPLREVTLKTVHIT